MFAMNQGLSSMALVSVSSKTVSTAVRFAIR